MNTFIKNGKATQLLIGLLIISGLVIVALSFYFIPNHEIKILCASVGLAIGSAGGYLAKTQSWGIKPFDNSYEEARKSYGKNKIINMKAFFINDGNLKEWIRIFLIIVGIGCVVVGVSIGITSVGGCFFFLIGFFFAAVGGYATQAHMLKIKPFDNEYENARKSYEEEKQE